MEFVVSSSYRDMTSFSDIENAPEKENLSAVAIVELYDLLLVRSVNMVSVEVFCR